MMLSAGENLAWVSRLMGHSDITITARKYARWLPNKKTQGNKALDTYGQYLVSIKNRVQ